MTRINESMIDLILTNCSQSFMHSKAIESGLSDFHKMTTMMRRTYTQQEPVKITYRDYTKFNKEKFISEFRAKKFKFKGHTLSTNTAYNNLIETLKAMLSVHAPIKRRLIYGNQAAFMNKKLSRVIMRRSELRNKYNPRTSTHNNSCPSCSYQTVQITSKNSGLSGACQNQPLKNSCSITSFFACFEA